MRVALKCWQVVSNPKSHRYHEVLETTKFFLKFYFWLPFRVALFFYFIFFFFFNRRGVLVKNIVVSIVRYAIRIVQYVSYCVQKLKSFVSYQCIVSVHESYDTVCVSYELYRKIVRIVRYIDKCFKMIFFVEICTFIWI